MLNMSKFSEVVVYSRVSLKEVTMCLGENGMPSLAAHLTDKSLFYVDSSAAFVSKWAEPMCAHQ
jgi:hypothetical protein